MEDCRLLDESGLMALELISNYLYLLKNVISLVMALLQLEFTQQDNTKDLPIHLSRRYTIIRVRIEAASFENLVDAIRQMSIYILLTLHGNRYKTQYSHSSC